MARMPRCCIRVRACVVRFGIMAASLRDREAREMDKPAIDRESAAGDPVAAQPNVLALPECREALPRRSHDRLENC